MCYDFIQETQGHNSFFQRFVSRMEMNYLSIAVMFGDVNYVAWLKRFMN